ncbi:MAG: type III-B CRISPR module RAMP protein Cmr6 [Planctomycetota bacterium]
MRKALRTVYKSDGPPAHLGLGYETWAPIAEDGKVADTDRAHWLDTLCNQKVNQDYAQAFERWRASFRRDGDRFFELAVASRLLVGHGNPSATDVGLTIHRTWGTPMIPGSALKGMLAHYVDAVYGPESLSGDESEAPADEKERFRYRGPVRRGTRVLRGPGDVYRAIFGAPDADQDDEDRSSGRQAGAASGRVTFHDALYVPGSAPSDQPFARDVITVHQKTYYDSAGRSWPNDYDDPNPVAFLTVRRGVRFLLVLSGPPDWTELARKLLIDALRDWGVGGKTSSGYGRLLPPGEVQEIPSLPASERGQQVLRGRPREPRAAPAGPRPKYRAGDRISVTRIEAPKGKVRFRADDGIVGQFTGETPPQVQVGDTVEVWVANVCKDTYTFTLKQPRGKKK